MEPWGPGPCGRGLPVMGVGRHPRPQNAGRATPGRRPESGSRQWLQGDGPAPAARSSIPAKTRWATSRPPAAGGWVYALLSSTTCPPAPTSLLSSFRNRQTVIFSRGSRRPFRRLLDGALLVRAALFAGAFSVPGLAEKALGREGLGNWRPCGGGPIAQWAAVMNKPALSGCEPGACW